MSLDQGDASQAKTSTPQKSKKLTIVVDGTRFICNAQIFNHHPTTLLGKMFSPQMLRPGMSYLKYESLYDISNSIFFNKNNA